MGNPELMVELTLIGAFFHTCVPVHGKITRNTLTSSIRSSPGPLDGSSRLTATNIIRSPVDTSMLVASSTQRLSGSKNKQTKITENLKNIRQSYKAYTRLKNKALSRKRAEIF